ncbi:MAG: hypothetical protein FWF60_00955 [Oscillospiraceae bacterium]|nr:hypothetical protein [Oscillospiraceae bacterium]
MQFPVNPNNPWYHGSPMEEMDVLRTGSAVTQWKELAEAFATKPARLEYGEIFGPISHNGREAGHLYQIDEPITIGADIFQYPRSTMDQGVEFHTKRPLKLRRIF